VWIEPGINGTLFTTTLGGTTASASSTVGLALDQSLSLAPNPLLLDDISGFTVTAGSGALVNSMVFSASGFAGGVVREAFINSGKTYRLRAQFTQTNAVELSLNNNNASKANTIYETTATSGSVDAIFVAVNSNFYLRLAATSTVTFSQISINQVLGNHASQATAANRPTLQQSGNLYFLRHDSTDFLTATLPALSGGNYSTTASIYFGTPQGMSSLHNQTIGTTYNLPALNTDVYGGWVVVPARLTPPEEEQLARYFRAKAGIVGSEDYFWQPGYLTDDSGTILLTRR
jgi:hypothetical protein